MTPLVAALTDREEQVLALLADGLSDKEIAARLRCSENTVGAHLRTIYRKLGVGRRMDAALLYHGLRAA